MSTAEATALGLAFAALLTALGAIGKPFIDRRAARDIAGAEEDKTAEDQRQYDLKLLYDGLREQIRDLREQQRGYDERTKAAEARAEEATQRAREAGKRADAAEGLLAEAQGTIARHEVTIGGLQERVQALEGRRRDAQP